MADHKINSNIIFTTVTPHISPSDIFPENRVAVHILIETGTPVDYDTFPNLSMYYFVES